MPATRINQRDISLAATVFQQQVKIGEYVVRDLSSAGALLAHGARVDRGTAVRVLLQGPGVESLCLAARVERNEIASDGAPLIALEFLDLTFAMSDQLRRVVARARDWRARQSVLVVHHRPPFLASMARDLARLGYHPLVALTELEVVCQLHDRGAHLQAMVAELSLEAPLSLRLFEFVREGFPHVRRIALANATSEPGFARAIAIVGVDHIIAPGWTQSMLLSALGRGDEA